MSPFVRRTRCRGAFGVACATSGPSTNHHASPRHRGVGLPPTEPCSLAFGAPIARFPLRHSMSNADVQGAQECVGTFLKNSAPSCHIHDLRHQRTRLSRCWRTAGRRTLGA